jgi:hypothetical protein
MYQLKWSQRAFNEMNVIIQGAPDRKQEFAFWLREITDELTAKPTNTGESRQGNRRIAFFGPFIVSVLIVDCRV